ncbi:MAG: dihydroorotase [Bacteroidetes bacterium]|nr:dihydroorotase [Bacteroidota bacterium]MBS1758416.1 dihydroorotase [Bacteroidota bacterium]
MQKYVFKNIKVVNEGQIIPADVLIVNDRIEKISSQINEKGNIHEINGEGLHLLPGAIDDQVHFREPGLTHKADIYTESRAAVAGGVTSFMEMPNTIPNALTISLLEDKYKIAAQKSAANYSFFMGVSNDNAPEALKVNQFKNNICGIKIFMGSSTGNMLVDNHSTLNKIFSESEVLIATHCEDERIIKRNYESLKKIKPILDASDHPIIRDAEACFESSLIAIQFAQKHGSRLHILHISTEKELQLFSNMLPIKDKRITAEVCVHHLHFTAEDYEKLGYKIKCNPAIKAPENKKALWQALNDDRLDVIATDHAPHLLSEKEGPYEHAHAGLPLVQHPVLLMLYHHSIGNITLETMVRKMSHAVADCFQIKDRGYIREGYFADLVVANLNKPCTVQKNNLLYKCGWSPLEGFKFTASIEKTMINGNMVYENGSINDSFIGKRLLFNR